MAVFLTAVLAATLLSPLAAACSSLQQLPSSLTPFTMTASLSSALGVGAAAAAAATTDLVVGCSIESISRAARTLIE